MWPPASEDKSFSLWWGVSRPAETQPAATEGKVIGWRSYALRLHFTNYTLCILLSHQTRRNVFTRAYTALFKDKWKMFVHVGKNALIYFLKFLIYMNKWTCSFVCLCVSVCVCVCARLCVPALHWAGWAHCRVWKGDPSDEVGAGETVITESIKLSFSSADPGSCHCLSCLAPPPPPPTASTTDSLSLSLILSLSHSLNSPAYQITHRSIEALHGEN